MTAPVSTHKTTHSTRADSKSEVRPLPSTEPASTIEPSLGQELSQSLDRYEGASRAADRQSVARAVVADMDGFSVSDADCEHAVAQLSTLGASDVKGAWEAMPDETRETLLQKVDGEARSKLVDTLTRGGVVKPEILPQPAGWGDVPKAPRLVVNDRAFDPAMRAMLHDENCARANTYAQAHSAYCDRYIDEVLHSGEPEKAGWRIRSNPVATSALPEIEPGTRDDGPLSDVRTEWKNAMGPDRDFDVRVARSNAVSLAVAVEQKILTFEAGAEVALTESTKFGGSVMFDAAGRPISGEVKAAAELGVVDLEGGVEFTVESDGSLRPELTGDVSVGVEEKSNHAKKFGAKNERARSRIGDGHDFDAGGVSVSGKNGGTVEVNMMGATYSASADGKTSAGIGLERGPVNVYVKMHMDSSKAGMNGLADRVRFSPTDIPEKLLMQKSWAELPESTQNALRHQAWSPGEWAERRAELLNKNHAQGMIHVFRR